MKFFGGGKANQVEISSKPTGRMNGISKLGQSIQTIRFRTTIFGRNNRDSFYLTQLWVQQFRFNLKTFTWKWCHSVSRAVVKVAAAQEVPLHPLHEQNISNRNNILIIQFHRVNSFGRIKKYANDFLNLPNGIRFLTDVSMDTFFQSMALPIHHLICQIYIIGFN